MGKSSKPLTIAIHPNLIGQVDELVAALVAKGHTAFYGGLPWEADLILAPQACRFLPGMEKMLDVVIKGVRAVKYPRKTTE